MIVVEIGGGDYSGFDLLDGFCFVLFVCLFLFFYFFFYMFEFLDGFDLL